MYALVHKIVGNIGEGSILYVHTGAGVRGYCWNVLRGSSRKIIGCPAVVACNQTQHGHGFIQCCTDMVFLKQ